jgi:sulfonate transport system substrate-binding protein
MFCEFTRRRRQRQQGIDCEAAFLALIDGALDLLAPRTMLAGDVDAAFGAQQLLDLAQKGTARIIYSTRNDSPKFTSNSAFFVTDAFKRQNPETTYRVVKALVKAAAWASDEANREAVFETWALSGVPAAIYRAEFEGQAIDYKIY